MPLFLTSRLLSAAGLAHGFSTREGGVSTGPFASLNVSRTVGDDPAHVAENLARLAKAAGLARGPAAFATAFQVHGDRVLRARWEGGAAAFDELLPESEARAEVSGERLAQAGPPHADAVVSLEPGLAATVRVADCTPILLHDPKSGAVAAVHSGWRGTRLRIAARGARALAAAAGTRPQDLVAAIGPCIGRCCYEVSADLAVLFREAFGPAAADDPAPSKPHLDLRYCIERALLDAGLKPEAVEQVPGCTSCEAERFFSHRRDRGLSGRQLAFVAPRGT